MHLHSIASSRTQLLSCVRSCTSGEEEVQKPVPVHPGTESDHEHEGQDNAPQIKPWKMEADDTELLDLLPFLDALSSTRVQDIRDVVRSYQGLDIPSAFK